MVGHTIGTLVDAMVDTPLTEGVMVVTATPHTEGIMVTTTTLKPLNAFGYATCQDTNSSNPSLLLSPYTSQALALERPLLLTVYPTRVALAFTRCSLPTVSRLMRVVSSLCLPSSPMEGGFV